MAAPGEIDADGDVDTLYSGTFRWKRSKLLPSIPPLGLPGAALKVCPHPPNESAESSVFGVLVVKRLLVDM